LRIIYVAYDALSAARGIDRVVKIIYALYMNAAPKLAEPEIAKPLPASHRVGDGRPGPGRPAGIPNKTTSALRSMLTMLAEFNVGHVQAALDTVRVGLKGQVMNRKGEMVDDWIVPPDPGKFADLYIKLVEFAAPKLQRSEVVTRDGGTDVEPIAATATQDEAQRAYLKMVQG
jgi:hypothetical protein